MRRIDTTDMVLVHYGREWPHPTPPCSKAMVALLERNEPLVYWLQPSGKAEQEQIPALKLPDGFYTLSLRMMKAIWRHVRLRKGFHNLERAQLGGFKLRIPTVLLTEKMRTQSRFNVSLLSLPPSYANSRCHVVTLPPPLHILTRPHADDADERAGSARPAQEPRERSVQDHKGSY